MSRIRFLAFLLSRAGDLEAAGVLRAAVQGAVEDSVCVSLSFCRGGPPGEGLEALKPLAESEDPDTQNAIGILLADTGRVDQALGVFDKV